MRIYVLPREDGRCRTWPHVELPKPYGPKLTQEWIEPEKVKPLRGMKSSVNMVLCVDGPLHRVKLNRKKSLMPMETFTVPPYRGRYEYDEEGDRFLWKM